MILLKQQLKIDTAVIEDWLKFCHQNFWLRGMSPNVDILNIGNLVQYYKRWILSQLYIKKAETQN